MPTMTTKITTSLTLSRWRHKPDNHHGAFTTLLGDPIRRTGPLDTCVKASGISLLQTLALPADSSWHLFMTPACWANVIKYRNIFGKQTQGCFFPPTVSRFRFLSEENFFAQGFIFIFWFSSFWFWGVLCWSCFSLCYERLPPLLCLCSCTSSFCVCTLNLNSLRNK